MSWKCPKCGSDRLTVDVTLAVMLYQYEKGGFETEDCGSNYEWDAHSTMCCRKCCHAGEVREFEAED